ncbi:MAG: MoaD/ThiS family protein [Ignavibacteriaceae bacterium]
MKIRINTFAVLKEYFEHSFEIEVNDLNTINDLKEELVKIKPQAQGLLNICRFAVNNTFVNNKAVIYENDNIFVIPPSSGG